MSQESKVNLLSGTQSKPYECYETITCVKHGYIQSSVWSGGQECQAGAVVHIVANKPVSVAGCISKCDKLAAVLINCLHRGGE